MDTQSLAGPGEGTTQTRLGVMLWALWGLGAAGVLLLSLMGSHDDGVGVHWTLGNYLEVLRTYLSRNAFWNMAVVAGVGLPLAFFSAWLIAPGLWSPGLWPPGRTGSGGAMAGLLRWALILLAVVGVLLPIGPGVFLWREFWAPTLWLADARSAIWAAGVVTAWRLTPILLLSRTQPQQPLAHSHLSGWGTGLCVSVWVVMTDVTVVWLLTRGEPFHASHTGATWAFQQAWTAGHWGFAAAIHILLIVLGGLLLAGVWMNRRFGGDFWARRRQTAADQRPADRPSRILPTRAARILGWVIGVAWLPLPLWLLLWRNISPPSAAQFSHPPFLVPMGMGQAAGLYGNWLVHSLLPMGVAVAFAWGVMWFFRRFGLGGLSSSRMEAFHPTRLGLICLGLLVLSTVYLPLGRFEALDFATGWEWLIVGLINGLGVALCAGGLWSMWLRPATLVWFGAVVVHHNLALTLVVDGGGHPLWWGTHAELAFFAFAGWGWVGVGLTGVLFFALVVGAATIFKIKSTGSQKA